MISDSVHDAASRISRELDEQGFSIVEDALTGEQTNDLKARLWSTVDRYRAEGRSTHTEIIDPNDSNVRLYALPEHDRAFLRLASDKTVSAVVDRCLGEDWLVSNFSANIARPGARAMRIHSDQALVFPEPWCERWALNVIWCLDDTNEANGATRYLPGSHRAARSGDLPDHPDTRVVSFEVRRGTAIVLDGRTWHSSGDNTTADDDRALLFAYYSRSFIRPQVCWHEVLSSQTIAMLDERQRRMFGFGALANTHGVPLVALS